jgi:predicted 3-demethylubiquinone-9 3-methyltransferase (glyoxalase superfamily)
MQRISPCLWFDGQAEEAVNFYLSIFRGSKVHRVTHYGEAAAQSSGRPKGSVLTIEFELDGQRFVALNGGPEFRFTEAVSLMILCKDQKEVDEYWSRLTEGGEERPCGWLKDRYGLSWQVVPKILLESIADEDYRKSERVMAAMLQMKKIDIAALERAAAAR